MTRNRKPRTAGVLSATLPALVLATSAVAQGLPPVEWGFSNGSTLRFYGQINKGFLQYDDGIDTETYNLIDNDNSGTRVGLLYTQDLGEWTFQNRNEFRYAPYSTANINIVNDSPSSEDYDLGNDNIRWIDFTFEHDRYGRFWIGQGSMATDGTLSVDLSGTDVIAYSSVADSAVAQILRFSDPGLEDDFDGPQIGDVFDSLDGDRRVRIRYDTPEYANFSLAAAFGRNLLSDDSDVRDADIFDASLNYGNTFDDAFEVAGSFGYHWREGVAGGDDLTVWGGSASVLHTPTGLNLTFAAATEDGEGDPSYWYGKLGLLRGFVDWGDTAMSVDYYSGSDFGLNDDVTSSSSESWGVALVQNIDRANTQLWVTWRSYDYDDDFAAYEDSSAIFGGARFRF